jgi:LysM repeat protein
MRSESVTVHKGEKEEKYKIYVEDYVISFLKTEADSLEMSEICFYGSYEEEKNEIVIYGAEKGNNQSFFDKYDFLEKITCRMTQVGPVFAVREKEELYEAQGYDIFYHENTEMQNYMIAYKRQDDCTRRSVEEPSGSHLHYTLTLQLGVIFVILVAIVINSTNSYDRMEQLNQSAKEVFFALENQEAEQPENAEAVSEAQPPEDTGDTEVTEAESISDSSEESENVTQVSDDEADTDETQQSTEALSRNVIQYYEIERGDTLYAICEEIYGDTSKVQQICDLNQISDPDDIRYGQKIILP